MKAQQQPKQTFRIYSPSKDAMLGNRVDANNKVITDGTFEFYTLDNQKAWGDLTLFDNPSVFTNMKKAEADVEMLNTIK